MTKSIGFPVFVGFGLLVVVLIINTFISHGSNREVQENIRRVAHTHEVQNALTNVLSTVQDAETGQRGYLLTEKEEYLGPYHDAIATWTVKVDRVKSLISDNPRQQDRLEKLRKGTERRMLALKEGLDIHKAKGVKSAREFILAGHGQADMDEIRALTKEMIDEEQALLDARVKAAERSYEFAVVTNLFATFLSLVMVGLAFYLVSREIRARNGAEAEAHKQREWFQTCLASIGDAVIVTDDMGRVTFLNRVAQKVTGWSQAAVGKHLNEVFHVINETTRVLVESPFDKVMRDSTVVGLANHTILLSKDGREVPIDDSGAPVRDKQGKIMGVVLVFRDVSGQRQAEGALRDSEERYRRLVEVNPVGIFVYADNQVVYANPAAAKLLRTQAALDLLGRSPLEFIYPEYQKQISQQIEQAIAGQLTSFVEQRWRGLDEGTLDVEVATHPLMWNGKKAVEVILRDIGDRKRAEDEIIRLLAKEKLQTARLRQLAEASLTIHGADSLDTVLRVITEEARRIINAHQSMATLVIDENWGQALHSVALSEKYAAWRDYERGPDGSGIHSLVCRWNKTMRLTQEELTAHPARKALDAESNKHPPMRGWLAAPFIGRAGRNLGLVQLSDKEIGEFTADDEAILAQLSHLAAVAIENARLLAELREADRRKDEFLAMLAHELRNPLAPVRNAVHILRLVGPANEELQWAIEVIERQVGQLTRLVDDLLDVSRITRGMVKLDKKTVELSTVVAQAVESSRPHIDAQKQAFTVKLPPDPIWVEADPTRLSQVLLNLLNNSAKYSEAGGRIELLAEREGSTVAIRVRDTGVGIAPEMLPRIFDLFTQVDGTLDRAKGGLGIGLTVVRRLVEMHEGSVEAFSAGVGKGSEFVVRLPVRSAGELPKEAAPIQERSGPECARRILVVDDNRDSAESLARLLRLFGHEVVLAHDGQAAMEAARVKKPDVAVLDIGLPGMNGYELARQLRQEPGQGRLILVALTGYGQDEDRLHSREAGFDAHLVKPVNLEELRAILAQRGVGEKGLF